ncbi:predicted protein [Postia placenta Mad-698-R]|nr:predicted protein [Postia placenta Mad-698-R]
MSSIPTTHLSPWLSSLRSVVDDSDSDLDSPPASDLGSDIFDDHSGLLSLQTSTALELAELNITVNAYCPGVIVSPMTTLEMDMRYGGRPGATIKALLGIPLDSPEVGPDVIASVVSYLVKPEAYFITGQSIDVNGGTYMG